MVPDGKLIALRSTRRDGFRRSIYVIKPDGTGLRKLIDTGDAPAWSPTESRLPLCPIAIRKGASRSMS